MYFHIVSIFNETSAASIARMTINSAFFLIVKSRLRLNFMDVTLQLLTSHSTRGRTNAQKTPKTPHAIAQAG